MRHLRPLDPLLDNVPIAAAAKLQPAFACNVVELSRVFRSNTRSPNPSVHPRTLRIARISTAPELARTLIGMDRIQNRMYVSIGGLITLALALAVLGGK